MNRRHFIAAAGVGIASLSAQAIAADKKLRVAVIGNTSRGGYGHGLDTVWLKLPETEIVAVSDADAAGLAAAQKKLSAKQAFADYHEMVKTVKPDIVAVCPRFVDEHCEMTLAAIEAGAKGIYIEKPFCRTPSEADQIIAAAKKNGAKIAVAHRNRYHPTLQAIDRLIADGGLGKVLELRGRGKSDARGGGEDLWVLGSHVLNLINYFGGAPKTCSALVKQNGERVTKAHVIEGKEGIGPLAGNAVHARYDMERGFVAYFDSIADDGTRGAGFGLQIIGSQGIIDIKCDAQPLAKLLRGNPFLPNKEPRSWVTISSAGPDVAEPIANLAELIGQHVAPTRDLIASMNSDREPLCGARDAAMTVEMIAAVFESHRQGSAAVMLPLSDRGNPLARL